MIKILVDSASDFDIEDAQKENIYMVPLQVRFGEETYIDQYEISKDEFFQMLIDGKKASTSQPSPEAFVKCYQEAKENNETVLAIMLSSKVSGTYQTAKLAKEIVKYDDIHFVDTLTASIGIQFVVHYAKKLIDSGIDIKEIALKLNKFAEKVNTRFIPNSIDDLIRNGRLSKDESNGNNTKTRNIIQLRNGTVHEYAKYRSIKMAIGGLLDEMQESPIDDDFPIIVGYSTDMTYVNILIEEIRSIYPKIDIIQKQVGAILGGHFGAGVFGVSYKTK